MLKKNNVRTKNTIKWLKEMRSFRKKKGYFEAHGHGPASDGGKIDYKLIAKSDLLGVTLADHGTMSGTHSHYKEMQKINKTAGIANEFYIENIIEHTYKNVLLENKKDYYHILLIAKNETGLVNLNKLTMLSYKRIAKGGKNVLNPHDLAANREGLICLTACIGGELPQYIINGEDKLAVRFVQILKKLFNDDLYLELQVHGLKEENILIPSLIYLSRTLDVKLVSTTDYHYSKESDRKLNEMQVCKLRGLTFADERKKYSLDGKYYHLPTCVEDAELRLADLEPEIAAEALDSTVEIWEKCKDLKISFAKNSEDYKFPNPVLPEGFNNYDSYLEKLAYEGYERRIRENPNMDTEVYRERLKYEIKTVKELKFSPYFIIVQDIIAFCSENGIWTGPGRGSASGCYLSYCLGITDLIDPIKLELLFERFLNKARKGAPDIDIDFCYERREEVFDYIISKYGIDEEASNCARIITFNRWGAKSGIKDAGRILGYDFSLCTQLANLVPDIQGLSLESLIEPSTEFEEENKDLIAQTKPLRDRYESDPVAEEIIDYAIELQGVISSRSKHAAGFVIADKPLWNYIPVRYMKHNGKNVLVTELTMTELEERGLLKFDILGLRTGTHLTKCTKLVNKNKAKRGETDFVKLNEINLEDKEVAKNLLGRGHTVGVFQAEGSEMTKLIKQVMNIIDDNFIEALIQTISINRPGPKQYIPKFINNLKNPEDITYKHEKLKNVLKTTHGILSYQEQVSIICQILAGFTPEEADEVRKIVSKKKTEDMKKLRDKFISGCVSKGMKKELATEIFDEIEEFVKYSFNKSHAASYTVLLMQTASMKYYYPVEFMTTLLEICCTSNNTRKKLPVYIAEAKRMGIKILPPCVNKSSYTFSMESDNEIRFGLMAIKDIGEEAAKLIENERIKNGEFSDYQDLVNRLHSIKLKKNTLDSKDILKALIYSGATDCLGLSRNAKINNIDIVKSIASENVSTNNSIELLDSLFGIEIETSIEDEPEYPTRKMLTHEVEYLSTFISKHILDDYIDIISNSDINYIADITRDFSDEETSEDIELEDNTGETARIIGVVTEVKEGIGKKAYLKYTISDHTGTLSGITGTYYSNILKEGNVVHVKGTIKHDPTYGTGLEWTTFSRVFGKEDTIQSCDEIPCDKNPTAVIYINSKSDLSKFEEITDDLLSSKGKTEMFFVCKETSETYKISKKVNIDDIRTLEFIKENSFGMIIR